MKTQREILDQLSVDVAEIKQGLYGVPNTEDNGMYGDVKSLCKEIKDVNTRQHKLSKVVFILCGVVGTGGGAGIWSLFQ